MSNSKLPAFERLMIFSSLISLGLLFYRCVFTLNFHYTYFLWNLIIAFAPYIVSKQLAKCKELNLKTGLLLSLWLVLFPGCVYLFTDVLQIHKTDNFSFLYDVILFLSFAWNSLLPGLMSLRKVEGFLKKHLSAFLVKLSVLFFIFLSSYGIFLVRFLHLKSWNIFSDSKKLLAVSANHILNPEDHIHAWLSIITLVMLIDVIYIGFKKLYTFKKLNQNLLF